ncbi:MAG: hypothetical protein IPO91_07275 [Chloroflexi bacterium]|uniref:hypothetical protein n=1 Tax=Candidatus Flexifilum breve TaxID=3140694 RepID=UPI0031357F06|nr:hypothetical protein [Chloroflexota bacterium]MBK9746570.1 hypothetical protein [Chloroflexota bacterium]
MSKNLLISAALIVLLACGLLTAAAPSLWKQITDSHHVNDLAQHIANFDLPAGYEPDYAVELLGYTVVAYRGTDEYAHLSFLQAPPGVIPNDAALEGYIPDDRAKTRWNEPTLVRTEQRTIRDQVATLTVSDRTNSEGRRYRSLNLVFQGREGTALIVINQPVSSWDENQIETFIASIH